MIELTPEKEQEVIDFYLAPNSAREIERIYGINWYQLKKLLSKYGVPQHSRKEAFDCRTKRTKKVCIEKYGVDNVQKLPETREKAKQTFKKKYGVEYIGQSPIQKEKSKNTCMNKYGKTSYTKTDEFKERVRDKKEITIEKMKETNLHKYGNEFAINNKGVQQKRKNTMVNRYGTANYYNSDKCIETCRSKYGVDYVLQVEDIKSKINKTKAMRHTFNTSAPEDNYYDALILKYGKNNVIRQYTDERYPFACDFYIIPTDTFVELNLHWTHGGHLFNADVAEDLKQLELWEQKAETSNFYKLAINVWTVRDVDKFTIATNNKLKYKSFYTYDEAEKWINQI